MIARVLAAVATAASIAAGPIGAPAIPLHEIAAGPGAANMCANVVVHANAAILATLRGDAALKLAVARLRTADFETPGNARQAALAEVARTSGDLSDGVDRAKSETQRLRDYARHPAGADRSVEIGAFVDPLDAALEVQRKAASDLEAFVTGFAYRDLRENARQGSLMRAMDPDDPDTFHTAGRPPTALATPAAFAAERAGPSATLSAKAQASDLEAFAAEIAADEARAAPRSEPAVGGC